MYVKIKTKVATVTIEYCKCGGTGTCQNLLFCKKEKEKEKKVISQRNGMCHNYVQMNSYIPFLECRLFFEKLFPLYYYVIMSKSSLPYKQYSVFCHCFVFFLKILFVCCTH